MEPMIPRDDPAGWPVLSQLSVEIHRRAGAIQEALPSPSTRRELARLVGSMNSYYSNLIEGHKTLPKDIERALKEGERGGPDERRNQRMSAALVRTEDAMRARLAEQPDTAVYSADFIRWLHREFYGHLPEEDRRVQLESGGYHPVPLAPGVYRDFNVSVHRHDPPPPGELERFMQRYETAYDPARMIAADRLIALAAAHHRLAWIHPFGDGNGRVARLQSQAALIHLGLDGDGLWTLSRGLARRQADYYRHLQNADAPRINDFDGRGARSCRHLGEFCTFFLGVILDQMDFMLGRIRPRALVDRIEVYVKVHHSALDARMQERLIRLFRCLCLEPADVPRGRIAEVLNVSATTATAVIKTAETLGLVTSDSPKTPLRLRFPAEVAEFYFPGLYSDLPVAS